METTTHIFSLPNSQQLKSGDQMREFCFKQSFTKRIPLCFCHFFFRAVFEFASLWHIVGLWLYWKEEKKSICFVSFHSTQCCIFFVHNSTFRRAEKTWIYELSLSPISMHDLQMLNVPFILKHLFCSAIFCCCCCFHFARAKRAKIMTKKNQRSTKNARSNFFLFSCSTATVTTNSTFHCSDARWNQNYQSPRELSRNFFFWSHLMMTVVEALIRSNERHAVFFPFAFFFSFSVFCIL